MKDVNILLCGNLWQNLGDHQAGWELIRCLRSSDPEVRDAAQEYLMLAGPRSINLLQAAVASGALEGRRAAECIVAWLADESAFGDLPYDC